MKTTTKEGRKEQLVGARLPQALVADLDRIENAEQSDRSTVVRKLLSRAISEWKLDHEARLYLENKVTLERAAMDAGVSVRVMVDFLKLKKIPLQYDAEDLQRDMERFYSKLGSTSPA